MSPLRGVGVLAPPLPTPALTSASRDAAVAVDPMGATALPATALDSYQGALTLGQTASSLGGTLQAANQLQNEAQKMWGGTAAGNAILNSPILQQERAVTNAVLPATTLAGALTDVADAQAQAGTDLARLNETLANPAASFAMKLQASAQATQSAALFVQKQQALINSLDSTDQAYLEQSPAYRQLMTPVQPAFRILGKINASYLSPIATAASVAGAGAGIIVGGFAMPGLVKGTVAAGQQFAKLLADPTASQGQKLEALANTTRGAAGVIYAASGINSGVSTLTGLAGSVEALAPAVEAVTSNPVVHDVGMILGTAFKVLLPIADAGTMVADGVTFKDKLEDPTATLGDKAKAFLAVSLDTMKVATYFFPATEGVRMAYMVASFGQMGFAMADLSKTLIPEMFQTAGHALDEARHPVQAFHALEAKASEAGSWIEKEVGVLGGDVRHLVANPGAAVKSSSIQVQGMAGSIARAWTGFTHGVSETVNLVKSAFNSNLNNSTVSPIASSGVSPGSSAPASAGAARQAGSAAAALQAAFAGGRLANAAAIH